MPSTPEELHEAREAYKRNHLAGLPPVLQDALTPDYPPGTVEYDEYRSELHKALDEWNKS